jgi:transcriptional regulator with XRE-family HTH domain
MTTRAGFSQIVRDRRRRLDLTQQEVARRVGTSTPYIGHLESGKRHPSQKVVVKLADVLGIDRAELFLLANPQAEAIVGPRNLTNFAWDEFQKDENIRRTLRITRSELKTLARVSAMGEVRSPRDFVFILGTIRQALGR